MLGDEGVEVVFYRHPGGFRYGWWEREPCESAAIDGMRKGLNGEVKGREWGGGEGENRTYYSAPPDFSQSHFL